MRIHVPLDTVMVPAPCDPSREVIASRGLVRMRNRKWESRQARLQFWMYAIADGKKSHLHMSAMLSISEEEAQSAILHLALQRFVTFEVKEKMDQTFNVTTLHDSFSKVKPYSRDLVRKFYTFLFEKYPQIRPLFPKDMQDQYEKFVKTLAFVVMGVYHNDAIEKDVLALGARHKGYKVQKYHYDIVGAVLLESLQWCYEERIKEAWTTELHSTWEQAYTLVATVMQKGAQ